IPPFTYTTLFRSDAGREHQHRKVKKEQQFVSHRENSQRPISLDRIKLTFRYQTSIEEFLRQPFPLFQSLLFEAKDRNSAKKKAREFRTYIFQRSNPIFTPSFVAMILVMRCLSSGIRMLSMTSFENAYIKSALASFCGIPRDCI